MSHYWVLDMVIKLLHGNFFWSFWETFSMGFFMGFWVDFITDFLKNMKNYSIILIANLITAIFYIYKFFKLENYSRFYRKFILTNLKKLWQFNKKLKNFLNNILVFSRPNYCWKMCLLLLRFIANILNYNYSRL